MMAGRTRPQMIERGGTCLSNPAEHKANYLPHPIDLRFFHADAD